MTSVVIDASVIGPLIFANEAAPVVARLPDLLARGACLAPLHWHLEVANMVLIGGRRGRIIGEASTILATLAMLPVELDGKTADVAWAATSGIAMTHGLTIYDAAYLELALRAGLPLMTFDIELAKAAVARGVVVIGADA